MEIHLIFYNTCYSNTDEAINAKDGILILVYMCNVFECHLSTVK